MERLCLSLGADANHSAVYCFDAERGVLKWQQYVTHNSARQDKMPDVNADTGYAVPTMTTDGQRVFAMFANGDVAAFDREGKEIWTTRLGVPDNPYGHAASLAMYRDLLLIQFDQGSGKDQRSRLLALNHITGQTTWVAQRDVPSSWSSPIVISIGQHPLIITAANPWLIAYNPTNGKEYWRVKCLRADVGPSPVFANGIIYTASESSLLTAIRVDMADPHAQPSVLWTAEDGLPDTASPLATDEFVFVLASYGVLTCYDARSGELLWDEEFDSDFSSSPSLVGTRLYLLGKDGKCWVLQPNRAGCRRLAESDLGEACVTSPAFHNGKIYIRGSQHLFCIGKEKESQINANGRR